MQWTSPTLECQKSEVNHESPRNTQVHISCVQSTEALAKKTGDDKKLKMVASRKKKLEDRMGMEKNEKGHRFSKNKSVLSFTHCTDPISKNTHRACLVIYTTCR